MKKIKEKHMALRGASSVTTDQEWIGSDGWDALAKEKAAAVFTVKEILPPANYGNGEVAAVHARVIILTGAQAGQMYDERIIKAGIRNKLTEIGTDVVGRLDFYGPRNAVGLEAEKAGDIELAKAALDKFNGSSSEVPARSKAKAKTVEADDSEPPF